MPPSRDVAIHFWSAKKCLTIDADINGIKRDNFPLPCNVKVSILQSSSTDKAEAEIREFIREEGLRKWKPIPLNLGEEGYVWSRSNIVFRKGRYKFFLHTTVHNYSYPVDNSEFEQEITKAFAQETARALSAN